MAVPTYRLNTDRIPSLLADLKLRGIALDPLELTVPTNLPADWRNLAGEVKPCDSAFICKKGAARVDIFIGQTDHDACVVVVWRTWCGWRSRQQVNLLTQEIGQVLVDLRDFPRSSNRGLPDTHL
jgi:hypothetical protein